PFIGEQGVRHHESEMRLEVIYPKERQRQILLAMFENHPYEEVAYNIYALKNKYQNVGSGMIGNLRTPLTGAEFLAHLKNTLDISVIRYTELLDKPIRRVAVCGGSGSF